MRRRPGRGGGPDGRGAARAAAAPRGPATSGSPAAASFAGPEAVVGSEAVYCDADDPRWIELRTPADPELVEAARRALPDARVEPIGTSARVGGIDRLRGRGDGGLRRSARRRARRRAGRRGAGARERGRRARPAAVAVRRGEGARWPMCSRGSSRSSRVPELPPPLPPGGAHRRPARRRDDPRLRGALLARAAARLADRRRRPDARSATPRTSRWSCSSRSRPLSPPPIVCACTLVHGARPTLDGVRGAVLGLRAGAAARSGCSSCRRSPGSPCSGSRVPAAIVERLAFALRSSAGAGSALADYVHALGSLAALVIVVAISELTLIALLRSQGDNGQRIAHVLADLVLSPLLFLGGALLYADQAARVGSGRPHRRSRRNADLHPPLDADPAGRPDPQVES